MVISNWRIKVGPRLWMGSRPLNKHSGCDIGWVGGGGGGGSIKKGCLGLCVLSRTLSVIQLLSTIEKQKEWMGLMWCIFIHMF